MHLFIFFFQDFIYLFLRDTHKRKRERKRGAETQAEGEADSTQGAQRGTQSQVFRSGPEPKAVTNC